ncbi:polyprenyl synthetase family protein [Jatrophihabitans sp.]|uniref:polyprenyl synthetase family protein n=1 Tax=Jatrophihabitans sp. TaxID=1932789 RepID=UPI0030C6DEDC|nr:Polyprenyl synthetase [Jatrophihabitans sp.]
MAEPGEAPSDEEIVTRVDRLLAHFLDERAESLAHVGPELAPMTEAARRLVLDGGKRLRPRFAYWGWRAVRPATDDDEAVVTAAASLELVHACALAHDDLMDSSRTRRGNPTAHVSFAEMHDAAGWSGASETFGASAAILLGDLLLAWADTLFARACLPGAQRVFDDMRQMVMAGQYLDVLIQARAEFSADSALRVAEFKTSKYTVEGPLHLGARAAGASQPVLAALTGYAIPLGEAFQLRDDVLGVFGDPSITGKPAGDDLLEGKQTLLVALAMQGATAAQGAALRADLGRRDLDADGIAYLREVIVGSGALEQVEARIAARAEQARGALTDVLAREARDALDSLITAATQRHV